MAVASPASAARVRSSSPGGLMRSSDPDQNITTGGTMGPKPRPGKQTTRRLAAISAIATLLVTPVAGAGLPKRGDWIYDIPTGTVFDKSEKAPTSFSAYVEFTGDGTGFIYSFSVITFGTCKQKNGRLTHPSMGGA